MTRRGVRPVRAATPALTETGTIRISAFNDRSRVWPIMVSPKGDHMSADLRLLVASRLRPTLRLALVAGTLAAAAALASEAAEPLVVSQKGRSFRPGNLDLKRGDTITIVNDDSDLLHHAYVETDKFAFDSGDQEPGSRTDVTFTESGVFSVLCGIHPKMRLLVRVE